LGFKLFKTGLKNASQTDILKISS